MKEFIERIVKNLVDRYNGKIRIASRVQEDYKQGTVFEMTLQKARFRI